jgi:DNA-binding response OmpR family regulator
MVRILVVEDEPLIADLIRSVLAENLDGHEVVLAGDGRAALAEMRRFHFTLVITDLLMPGMEGMETIRALRQIDPALRILAISGGGRIGSSASLLGLAKHLGADHTLEKPFGPDALLAAVDRCLAG